MKKIFLFLICLSPLAILLVTACKKDEYKNLDCGKTPATYQADIRPIIESNCLSSGCHNAGSINGDFTGYAGLKGKANNGSLNKRVLEKKDMPSGGSLSLEDRGKIKCWLSNGASNN